MTTEQKQPPESPGGKPAEGPSKEHKAAQPDFDAHLAKLLRENHPRVMNLEMPIPKDYPWEELLRRHFALPPFRLEAEDYEVSLVANKKFTRIKETRKPTTFYALFRFLEFFRSQLATLQANLTEIEAKYDLVRRTTEETTGLRGLLRSRQWNYDQIDNKHEIIQKSLHQKSGLEDIMKKLEGVLTKNMPVTSKWQYMIEPLYMAVIDHINTHFRMDGVFNLRMFYPVRAMEEKLSPHYSDAMHLVVELVEAVNHTSSFLQKKR